MSLFLICGGFVIIAAMRVIQRISTKTSSLLVSDGYTFFKYGAAYQGFAALFSLITAIIVGFNGINLPTFVCAAITAIMFGIDLFCSLEAIKGCSLVVANTFANGGLIISVIASYIWFGEGVSAFQIAGLVVFFVSVYLLSITKKEEKSGKISPKTFVLLIIDLLANGAIMIVQKYFALRVENANTALFSLFTFAFCSLMLAVCALVVRIKAKASAPSLAENAENSAQNSEKTAKKQFLSGKLVLCAVLLALALFAINYIVTEMGHYVDSVVLFPVSAAISALATALVGLIVYKEKPNAFGVAGIVLGLVSIILLSVFTPSVVASIFG